MPLQERRLPTQQTVRERGVYITLRHVAGAARGHVVRNRSSTGQLEGMHYLQKELESDPN